MIVETLEIKETENNARNEQVEAEAIDLIEKLGLDGQDAFVGKDEETNVPIVMPYRKATEEQRQIINLLFPQKTCVEKYSEEPIPLEVLKVIALVRTNYAQEMPTLLVRHVRGVDKDPILVGAMNEYSAQYFLLARWGDALDSWEVLKKRAAEVWRENCLQALAKVEAELKMTKDMVQNGCVDMSVKPSLEGVDFNKSAETFEF